ncbi:MAG: DUF58 domain-containing protein [Aquabacterium sp.]|uniref:DUF58 domain-containing protein n=1 Tax=Aquabacterium sp. TaxID=1872578 RepID=UPI002723067D|nr:DUF58 domain-containing protein [Aquabacterium sp.]MDO9003494.1 DUF58 domain-containing protein [Aquabacterium sp.]
MRRTLIPSRRAVVALTVFAVASACALVAGLPLAAVGMASAVLLAMGAAWAGLDLWRSEQAWRQSPLRIERTLPHALALGVPRVLSLTLVNEGRRSWQVAVFDEVDPKLEFQGLPQSVSVPAASRVDIHYTVTPRQRGIVHFGATQVRMQTLGGSFETLRQLGHAQSLHVYPNFAAVAGYAWLAGDRRLAQIGIKTYAQRGMGTDFKQLTDYKVGDPIRHIDWKATMRHGRPIVREFQDERDQCVIFLLDCGRRMRADEGTVSTDGSHFDQALNALMLMSYVALKDGDEVGAMTFGTAPGQQRHFAPRKGSSTLNALMARLHDIEPDATHSDYLLAAQDLLRVQHKRALVVLLTNFRDEDSAELQPALKLLRARHLVLVASLRERVLREVAEQAIEKPGQAIEVAGAHWFEQARRDAFRRVVGLDALSVDVEPGQLAVALVNRYHAVKRSGLL